MMEDFNAMNSSIEAGLTKSATDAASAKQSAQNAENSAAAAAAARPYAVGSYTGDNTVKTIHLGFRPSYIIITGMLLTNEMNDPKNVSFYFGMSGGNVINTRVSFTNDGFTVFPLDLSYGRFPHLNDEGRTYDYIAFK